MKKTLLILSIFFLGINCSGYSQEVEPSHDQTDKKVKDTTYKSLRRNVIKWNLTPMIWNTKNINLSYERVTSNHGSFSVNTGYFVLPLGGGSLADSFNIAKTNKNFGFSISGDKRWYFKKRNKGFAPDGLYWGVFGSVHYYEFESRFTVFNPEYAKGNLVLNGNIGIISAGVELGYQFVLKNNLTIDLIFMGPALSTYSGKLGISGDLEVKESEYIKAIYDVIVTKFPGAKELFSEKSLKESGAVFNLGPGLRYMVQIGYRF